MCEWSMWVSNNFWLLGIIFTTVFFPHWFSSWTTEDKHSLLGKSLLQNREVLYLFPIKDMLEHDKTRNYSYEKQEILNKYSFFFLNTSALHMMKLYTTNLGCMEPKPKCQTYIPLQDLKGNLGVLTSIYCLTALTKPTTNLSIILKITLKIKEEIKMKNTLF